MGGFEGKRVIETRGRWSLEQLGPIDLCFFEAELAAMMGETMRAALRLVVAFLAEPTTDEDAVADGPWSKLERVMKALHEDPRSLVGRLMDRDIIGDAERIAGTLVDMIRSVSPRELRGVAEKMLVRQPGRMKGGLMVAIAPGEPPSVNVDSMAALDGLIADDPHELWRLILWGLELNLRPLIGAFGTARERAAKLGQATASSDRTPSRPGASSP